MLTQCHGSLTFPMQPDWTSNATHPAQYWSGQSQNGTIFMLVSGLLLFLLLCLGNPRLTRMDTLSSIHWIRRPICFSASSNLHGFGLVDNTQSGCVVTSRMFLSGIVKGLRATCRTYGHIWITGRPSETLRRRPYPHMGWWLYF